MKSYMLPLWLTLFATVGIACASKPAQFDLAWEAKRATWIAVGRIDSAAATDCVDSFGNRAYKFQFLVEQTWTGAPPSQIEITAFAEPVTAGLVSGNRFVLFFGTEKGACGNILSGPGFLRVSDDQVDIRKVSLEKEMGVLSEFKKQVSNAARQEKKSPVSN